MRYVLIVFWMFCSVTSAMSQISDGIDFAYPGESIGINVSMYPQLIRVPGYPVYYAPRLNSNFFFYDGMYWVYQGDNWYASSWYNGPWGLVEPEFVPLFVLRIPVRYYRVPPVYFRRWASDAPPRWGEHWGTGWEEQRRGWNHWSRSSMPAPAPLPAYQREYSGNRYPHLQQQQQFQSEHYRYQPREAIVQQQHQEQARQHVPAPSQEERPGAPQDRGSRQQEVQRSNPLPIQQVVPAVPRSQPQQKGSDEVQRAASAQAPHQQRGTVGQDQKQQRQKGSDEVQRATPSQAPPQPKGPAVPEQKQPQQGAAQRAAPTHTPTQQKDPAVHEQKPEPKGRQGQEKDREKRD